MFKIAAAQIKIESDIAKNLKKILEFIERAKAKKADIVCFPEVCLNSSEERFIDVSQEIKKIQNKCKEQKIWVIISTYIPQGRKMKNTTFLIDRTGEIKYQYYKVHPWITEREEVIAGKTNRVIYTEFGNIGIINCWDLAFPSFIQQLSRHGARIIFCPTCLIDYKKYKNVLQKIPQVRAFENLSYFIMCDVCAADTLSESYICHPLKVLKSIKKKEGIICADLVLDEIDYLRNYYDHLRDPHPLKY